MADEIRNKLGLTAQLVKGHGGVFHVTLDDEVIFSKKQVGRFPEPGEVANALQAKLA